MQGRASPMRVFQRLLHKYKAKRTRPVIIVGTDYSSYQLASYLLENTDRTPKFFINNEPWHHRTHILGAKLHYEIELISLIERHQIATVYCVTEQDFQYYASHFQNALAKLDCQLILCLPGQVPADINLT